MLAAYQVQGCTMRLGAIMKSRENDFTKMSVISKDASREDEILKKFVCY
jgi:succinylglutamate desuccinylase